jgi:hypothetical protein
LGKTAKALKSERIAVGLAIAWGFEILIIKIILGALTYLRFNKPKGELLALPYLLPTFG